MKIIRFDMDSEYDIMFSVDIKDFIFRLFNYYNYNKLRFSIIVGSPHEKMYDRFSRKYGGRIVGTLKQDFKLQDGTVCDRKLYEVLREDFLKSTGVKNERR